MIWNSVNGGVIALATLPVLLWLGKANPRRNVLLALLFAIAIALDNFLTTLPIDVEALRWFGNRHDWLGIVYSNWEGKTYSIVLALTLMLALYPWFDRKQFGLTLRQRPGSVRPVVILGVVMLLPITPLGLLAKKGPFDGELLLYLLFMPGLSEELVYRGLLLSVADVISPPRWNLAGAPIGWGVIIVSFVFGLMHGLSVAPGWRVDLDFTAFLLPAGYGLACGWMRERTGSLLVPTVFHGLTDFLGFFWRMV